MELIKVVCPTCGGQVNIPKDSENIFCNFCGNKFVIKKEIYNSPKIENYIQLAKAADDAENHQEAINYYNKIIEIDANNYEAWIGKGYSIALTSTLASPKIMDMASYFSKAYEIVPQEKKDEALNEITTKSLIALQTYFGFVETKYKEFREGVADINYIQKQYKEQAEHAMLVVSVIQKIKSIAPNKSSQAKMLFELGLKAIKDNRNGIPDSFEKQNTLSFQYSIDEIKGTIKREPAPYQAGTGTINKLAIPLSILFVVLSIFSCSSGYTLLTYSPELEREYFTKYNILLYAWEGYGVPLIICLAPLLLFVGLFISALSEPARKLSHEKAVADYQAYIAQKTSQNENTQ